MTMCPYFHFFLKTIYGLKPTYILWGEVGLYTYSFIYVGVCTQRQRKTEIE